jgi:hypothetical protein
VAEKENPSLAKFPGQLQNFAEMGEARGLNLTLAVPESIEIWTEQRLIGHPVSMYSTPSPLLYISADFKKLFQGPRPFQQCNINYSKRKHKRFDIEAYYRNKTKTFRFGPLIIGTISKRFCLLQTAQESKENVCIFKKL